jgi:hypothetical protein
MSESSPPPWTPQRAEAAPFSEGWCHALRRELVGVGTGDALHPALHAAYRLLRHPNNAAVRRRVGEGYTLVETGQHLDGLTQPLRDIFYPANRAASTGGARTGGSSRGTQVDREITALVNRGAMPASGRLHPYAHRMLDFLHRHRLQPCAAQFIVYDLRLRIATEIDIVCIDLRARYEGGRSNVVFVECKTGFDRNYEVPSGWLFSPFVDSSPLTRIQMSHRAAHQLQALVQYMMGHLNYDRLVLRAVVLVLSESENRLFSVARDLDDCKYDVYQNLRLRLTHGAEEVHRRGAAAAAREARARAFFS